MSETLNILLCSVLLASAASFGRESARKRPSGLVSHSSETESKFDRALDELFRRPREDNPHGYRFVMVLRFLPSSHPPCQIVLSYGARSEADVEYRALNKRLGEVVPPDEGSAKTFILPGPEELATLTGLKRVKFSVTPGQMKGWLKGFLDSLAPSSSVLDHRTLEADGTQEIVLQLDGTAYILELQTPRDHLSLSFSGSEIDTDGPHRDDVPVVNWVNSVRREITKVPRVSQ